MLAHVMHPEMATFSYNFQYCIVKNCQQNPGCFGQKTIIKASFPKFFIKYQNVPKNL